MLDNFNMSLIILFIYYKCIKRKEKPHLRLVCKEEIFLTSERRVKQQ